VGVGYFTMAGQGSETSEDNEEQDEDLHVGLA
jgi:hypothetical protein